MNGGFDARTIDSARAALSEAVNEADRLGDEIARCAGEQDDFNDSVRQGTNAADGLVGKIMGLVGAYAGLQSVGKLINTSDDFTQTTARIGMMNNAFNELNGTETETSEMMNLIYRAAQDARGSFGDMADVVARFGNNARDAFSSQEEVVAFANLIQKQMTIAGAGTAEASNAMLQLSQALGSGKLRGDELNSIFEQAPNLIQTIADYIQNNERVARQMADAVGVSYESMSTNAMMHIRSLAEEGQLSADIVKNAIFDASDEINTQFESMPMTWGQIWTSMKNTALMQFQPVLNKISEMANDGNLQNFLGTLTNSLSMVAMGVANVIELIANVTSFFIEHMSTIAPILAVVGIALLAYLAVLTVVTIANKLHALSESIKAASMMMSTGATFAATAAQHGFNAALMACPLTWIIMLILAVVVVIILLVNWIAKATGAAQSGIGIVVGALAVAGAFIGNIFIALINFAIDAFAILWNFIGAFVNFFANVFTDPVGAIARLFFDLVDTVLQLLESLASAIDTIFGSNLAGAVSGWRSGLKGWVDDKFGKGDEVWEVLDPSAMHLDRFEYGEAWDAGVQFGDGLADKLSFDDPLGGIENPYEGYDASQIPANISETAENTGEIADTLTETEEELKYLRDIAEREIINRFTTAEIKIEQTNNNNINSDMDIDGIMDKWNSDFEEILVTAAEGVHA
jgi:tape measure domain-containing protein